MKLKQKIFDCFHIPGLVKQEVRKIRQKKAGELTGLPGLCMGIIVVGFREDVAEIRWEMIY